MKRIIYFFFLLLLFSCSNEKDVFEVVKPHFEKAIAQQDFDWENADFMPTPEGAEKIMSPWSGSGSLLGTYGTDIINDRKKSEGWTLLYNSFTSDANLYTPNPFFVLYNKYRGIMRIFYYATDPFITSSSNIIDNLSIISDHYSSSIFNLADQPIINGAQNRKNLTHIQPQPFDGSKPVASHRWYMAQYELAYDPNISSIPYDQIMLNFNLNYRNISSIKINSEGISKFSGIIGEESSGGFNKAFNNVLQEGGKAVLSNIGYGVLKKYGNETGGNSLGFPEKIYKGILSSLEGAAKSSSKGIWSACLGLFNSVLFGTKTSPTPIHATISTNLKATGESTNSGSMPSMPINLFMPGTNIPSNAVGRIPLYNKPLGVFNIKGCPRIYIIDNLQRRVRHDDPYNPGAPIIESKETYGCAQYQDYAAYLVFNPEVEKIADINIINSQVFAMDKKGEIYDETEFSAYNSGEQGAPTETIPNVTFYYYVAVEVKPKDGSPSTIISKTFNLDNHVTKYDNWLPELK